MLLRTVVSLVALPVLFWALYFSPDWVLPVLLTVISLIAVYELLFTTGFVTHKFLLFAAELFGSLIIPWVCVGGDSFIANIALYAFVAVLFAIAMLDHKHATLEQISGTFFAAIFIPLSFSSVIRITQMENGIYLVILPFVAAWITDSCAYFVGVTLGKHRIAPYLSPKKTVEGTVGGILGCMLGMLLYGGIIQFFFNIDANYVLLALLGMIGALAAEFGDLSMSFVKRQFRIKDYGNIMPGHGGILDRFDSLLFAAPVVEILLLAVMVFKF